MIFGLGACAPAPAPAPSEPAPAARVAAEAPHEGSAPDASLEPPVAVALPGLSHPGCFMLLELGGEGPPGWAGEQPCAQRTIPASTFKIPHALIALDTGVVTDADAMMKWDGREHWITSWQRDHSLRTAIYESVVWFFQDTARQIGRERMGDYLEALDYGNARVEGPVDAFWLDDGSLQISAEESLRFMARLYSQPGGDELARGREHLPLLRSMLVRPPQSFAGRIPAGTIVPEVHPELIFSAKTGTGGLGDGSVTWLVGHVACPERAYVFVSRVVAAAKPQVESPAVTHGLAALDQLGVLRCEG